MAQLDETARQQIWRGLMRYWSAFREAVGVSKADLRAAVDAADTWVDNNSASFNSALPEAFRTTATNQQKSLLLVAVVLRRYDVELLKKIFGEVD